MKKYFKLFEECFIVNGKNNYAIYNVISGKVYSISVNEGKFCALAENNYQIEEASINVGLSLDDTEKVVAKLVEAGLGGEYDFPVSSDKISVFPKWMEKTFFKQANRISRATIELDYECNENCFFCLDDSFTNRYKCLTCNGKGMETTSDDDDIIFKIIDIISARNCKELYLKNGDLINNWKRTSKIIEYARNYGIDEIKISVVRPIADEKIINALKHKNISVVYQLCLSEFTDIDYVLQQLNILTELRVTFLLLIKFEQKDSVMNLINTLLSRYPKIPILVDFIISSKRTDVNDEYFKIESTFGNVNFINYSLRQAHNECFYMSFCFDRKGDIYPCAGLKQKIGNISTLSQTFKNSNLKRFYNMSLSKKSECSECELRYACNVCESLNYTFNNNYAENILCFKKNGGKYGEHY